MTAELPHVVIHTDGACSGNPGPGGWGAILAFGDREKEIKGGEVLTTNNRMELMAAISALEALKRPCRVDLHTDSQYLRNGVLSWMANWKRNGWRTSDKKPVKNVDLWKRLDQALMPHQVHWHWLRGHAGHALNERADVLGTASDRGNPQLIGLFVWLMSGEFTVKGDRNSFTTMYVIPTDASEFSKAFDDPNSNVVRHWCVGRMPADADVFAARSSPCGPDREAASC